MSKNEKQLQWAIELQSLAQAGLTYGNDLYDLERYERIREISAEILSDMSDIPTETVKNLFCNETGYQTPKIDTRAAIFKEDKILLVCENNGKWSLPGGWCDVNISVGENAVKEVKEESGLDVIADSIIAVQDRAKHNLPLYAYGVCKVFVLCSTVGGCFRENIETTGFDYFSENNLPELATEKIMKNKSKCVLMLTEQEINGRLFLINKIQFIKLLQNRSIKPTVLSVGFVISEYFNFVANGQVSVDFFIESYCDSFFVTDVINLTVTEKLNVTDK